MKTLHLTITVIVLVIVLVPISSVFGQAVNMSPQVKPEFTAKMDKMYYNNTDTAHVTISGPPSTPVNLSVIDSSYQQKLATVVQLDSNRTGIFSFNLTSYNYGIYTALVGYGYDRVKIDFGVGLLPSESAGMINFNLLKSDYIPNDIIQIQGFNQPNSIVLMYLVDPSGTIENSTQVTSNSTGHFWAKLGIPNNAANGTWKVTATSGVNHETEDIVVHSSIIIPLNAPPPNIPTNNTNISNLTSPVLHAQLYPTPLVQFKQGTPATDVECNSNLTLILKAEDGSPACVKPDTVQKLIERGWGTTMTGTTNKLSSTDVCGQFYTAPENQHVPNAVPVLLMSSNSTTCAKITFTIYSNVNDCNGQTCPHIIAFDSTLHINNLHYEKHDNMFSVSSGKDYTNSFNITTIPDSVDLANYPIGTNFTVTYIIKPLPNATGFYDQSIPKLACERYPLAVGYLADQVNASDFSYIDQLNPPCAAGVYTLAGVEISGMTYKQVALQP